MASGGRQRQKVEEVVPAAGRTITSLRDIGYELPQAIADLVDNSIEARANQVRVDIAFAGEDSWIRIADNGDGMDTDRIKESLRIGSMRDYDENDLGKFGFGLKTASLSQCRRFIVASRVAPQRARIEARVFDVGHIEATNRWEVLVLDPQDRPNHLTDPLQESTGTVVLWENLDRILIYKDPAGVWARRKLLEQTESVAQHLAMVFHRFISGKVRGRKKVKILVNGALVEPWDPFCTEEDTRVLEPSHYPVTSDGAQGIVSLQPYVLPGQSEFSNAAAWTRASGPNKWNHQQGLYVYRADRLIQWGGWSRLRTVDEHMKLARVALDFSPDLDSAFGINISKAIVKLPVELRDEIQPVIKQVCAAAEGRYRGSGKARTARPPAGPKRPNASTTPRELATPTGGWQPPGAQPPPGTSSDQGDHGTPSENPPRSAIERAADAAGERVALDNIVQSLRTISPGVAHDLGW